MSKTTDAMRLGQLVAELEITCDAPIQIGERSSRERREMEGLIDWEDIERKCVELDQHHQLLFQGTPPSRVGLEGLEQLAPYFGELKAEMANRLEAEPAIHASYDLGVLLMAVVVTGLPREYADPFVKRLAANLLVLGIPQEAIAHLVRPLLSEQFEIRAAAAGRIEEAVREVQSQATEPARA